jgi:hypothetical protein
MADTLGTDAGNLTGQGGAVTNTAGDTLIGTDNDGGESYALGPSLSRAIETGIINGDFGTPPPELNTNIDNDENALPYFSVESTPGTGITVQAIADATAASGHILRFTIPSGTPVNDVCRVYRYVAVPGSAARTWTNQPRAAWRNATGTTKTQASVAIRTQYYQSDAATTTGTAGNNSATFTTIAASTYAYETQANPNGTGAIPTDGAYLRIAVGVVVNVLTTSEMTVDLTEVRYDRGVIQLLLADQVDPSAYGYGVIYLNNGTMWIRANELGTSGTNPTIYLSGSTGNIVIDPTSTGTMQVQSSASVTGSLSAASISTSGNADISGTIGVLGSINIGVSDTSTVGDITFKGGNGGSIRAFSAAAGNDSIGIYNTSGSAFAPLVADTFFPGGQGSFRLDHDGNFDLNDSLDVTGNVTATGAVTATGDITGNNIKSNSVITNDTPATTTSTTQGARWTLTAGTTYRLDRITSSARFKTNIVDADAAVLAASRRVHPRHYESIIETEAGETRLGFIAEELHAAGLTHAVGYDAEGRPDSLDPVALIAALWKRVEDLEERLATLEGA